MATLASAAFLYRNVAKNARGLLGTGHGYGSLTSASDAVDNIQLSPDAAPDEVLDAGVEHTFPASDPVAVQDAYQTAYEREQRRSR